MLCRVTGTPRVASLLFAWAAAAACASCGGAVDDAPVDVAVACAGATATRTERVKVLTINLRHDSDQWERRFELIADEIARLDPDLIGMQEVQIRSAQAAHLNALLERRGHARYEVQQELKSGLEYAGGEGVAVMSRWPIVRRADRALASGRVAVLARVRHPAGGELDVLSTHLSPGTAPRDEELRLAQARGTVALADANLACAPTFVTGDMNTRDRQPPLQAMFRAGFVDSYRAIHGDAAEPGGNTAILRLREGAFEQAPRSRIDFVLGRGAGARTATPIEAIVGFKNHDEKGFYPSDHLGVMTTFEVRL